ncbi:MAG: T9SS-dependent M36 family metallopeptidase [Saprospiraceae bacterium]|nr:T9SS-dependent M36 family metallopeptidase [Saprospiraceae bacterium]
MKIKLFNLLVINALCFSVALKAQVQSKLDLALRAIEQNAKVWGLNPDDISDLAVSDMYTSDHNGLTHIYLIQRYQGIEIHNAITSVHITPNGKIYDSPSRFIDQIRAKVNTTKARLSPIDALSAAVIQMDIPNALIPSNVSRTKDGKMEIMKTNFTNINIPVKQVYCLDQNGSLRLSWDLTMDLTSGSDYWSVRVDAQTGKIIDKQNLSIKCNFDHPGHSKCLDHQKAFNPGSVPVKEALAIINQPTPAAPNTYNVVSLPSESPKHGNRQLVVNPANATASPFGWHDTNGANGAEYQITRGNNVHAYLDRNGDNASDGGEPNGGTDLIFDFPFDPNTEPGAYTKAATVNLFYLNNMMHDVLYNFGYNEVAGNFQSNNYNKGGAANDQVLAEAQDGSGTDNANFATPADGGNPRMQMFLWLSSGVETYISKPDSLIGAFESRRASGWGGAPPPTREAEVVIANDHSPNPTLACSKGMRRSEIQGKIVLIDRGTCEFGVKALNAQDSGAVAVVICNFEDAFITMGAGAVGNRVTIPAYFTTKTICNRLKLQVKNGGLRIEIREPGATAGPDSLDGDFDNGIIAHEYGHGVSNRLTGGPARANCLNNAEQMGEGWSDFLALIMTAKPGDAGQNPRGIGTYALNQATNGLGIRRRPYSTDFSYNEFTYKNIDAESHNLGEVWTTVLWDMYWALANKYGYDPDFKNKTAGNNIAIQLVMDGMKLQPCLPGFIDGRNAILKADTINNAAANACLLWEVFARRGFGFFSKQGSSNSVGDETEDYLPALICINKLLVNKRAGYYKDATTFIKNDVVKPGDQYSYTLEINNYKPGVANNVVVTDNLPAGCTYVAGSGNPAPVVNGTQLVWTYSQLKSLESKTITYKVKSDPAIMSTTLWYDDMEAGEDNWDIDISKGTQLWYRDLDWGVNQSYAWIAEEKEGVSNDYFLFTKNQFQLSGADPSLYFYHFFNTEKAFDGGMIEVSTDGFFWLPVKPEQFSLNGYTGLINYETFVIPNSSAFSGQSTDFIPTVLSLKDYGTNKIQIRFRFGNDSLNVSPNTNTILGWVIDNVEFIYPKFYNAEVCVATAEGDLVCTSAPGKGTLADSDKIIGTQSEKTKSSFKVYPNPASNYFLFRQDAEKSIHTLIIRSVNGQELKRVSLPTDLSFVKISTDDLPKGIVILEGIGKGNHSYSKIVIK